MNEASKLCCFLKKCNKQGHFHTEFKGKKLLKIKEIKIKMCGLLAETSEASANKKIQIIFKSQKRVQIKFEFKSHSNHIQITETSSNQI